jgi:hypothetical protein
MRGVKTDVDSDVTATMMKMAIERGFTAIPSLCGDHYFPLDFIISELLGKEVGRSFDKELTNWRRSGLPMPEPHAGAKGRYYQLFDFLEKYHEFKIQEKGK